MDDRAAISELLADWADCLDRKEFGRLAEFWAEDCRFATYENHDDYGAGSAALGGVDRDDSIAKLGGLLSRIGQTHHLIGNIRVKLAGERANGECLVRTYHAASPTGNQGHWESLARMYFVARKTDRWRLAEQHYVVLVGLGTQDIFRRRTTIA